MPYKELEKRRECGRVAQVKYRAKNPEKIKAANDKRLPEHKFNFAKYLERTYGITADQHAALLQKQGGLCAICRQPETKQFRGTVVTLSVDHDHTTGRVRGLLCHKCNVGIGHFNDDVDLLKTVVSYLESSW